MPRKTGGLSAKGMLGKRVEVELARAARPLQMPCLMVQERRRTRAGQENCSKRELNASAFRRGANSPLWQAERKAKGGDGIGSSPEAVPTSCRWIVSGIVRGSQHIDHRTARRVFRGKVSYDVGTARGISGQSQTRLAHCLSQLDFVAAPYVDLRQRVSSDQHWRIRFNTGCAPERDWVAILGPFRHRAGSRCVLSSAQLGE